MKSADNLALLIVAGREFDVHRLSAIDCIDHDVHRFKNRRVDVPKMTAMSYSRFSFSSGKERNRRSETSKRSNGPSTDRVPKVLSV